MESRSRRRAAGWTFVGLGVVSLLLQLPGLFEDVAADQVDLTNSFGIAAAILLVVGGIALLLFPARGSS